MQQPQPTSSNSNSSIPGLERPATAFLSYAHEEANEVKYLQQHLKVRGVRAWRDVTDLPLGSSNEDEITHAIKEECEAFVIYITPQFLKSDFIWKVEVPAALERREHDHVFNIVPVLHGVTFDELEQFCAAHGHRSLKEFNGVPLPERTTSANDEAFNKQLRLVAKQILEATLDLRLRRVGADRNRKYEPCIYLRTHEVVPLADSLDLDLDWTELFPSKDELPKEEEWDEVLLPALDDVKNTVNLKTPSHRLHIYVQAHLPAAFALGFAFPASAYLTLLLEGRHGTWSTEGTVSMPDPLRRLTYQSNGDPRVALMELAIARDTALGVTQSLPGLGISYKHHIRFELPGGSDYRTGVKDTIHALAMSYQVGRELRRLCDREGVSHLHLFAALPAALAVMIGHQFNAICAITLYHYLEKDQLYKPVCTLGKQKRST